MSVVSARQGRVLVAAHTSTEGKVASGTQVDGRAAGKPTLAALGRAGLLDLRTSRSSRNGHVNFGRTVAYRPVVEVSVEGRITAKGQRWIADHVGLDARVECAVEGCESLAKTPAGYCGLGCERGAAQ